MLPFMKNSTRLVNPDIAINAHLNYIPCAHCFRATKTSDGVVVQVCQNDDVLFIGKIGSGEEEDASEAMFESRGNYFPIFQSQNGCIIFEFDNERYENSDGAGYITVGTFHYYEFGTNNELRKVAGFEMNRACAHYFRKMFEI